MGDDQKTISPNDSAADNEARLNLLYEIGRILASTETMEESAPQILKAICSHLQSSVGELWSLDPTETVLRRKSVWHQPSESLEKFAADSLSLAFPIGEGLPGRVWERNTPVWIENLSLEKSWARRLTIERAEMRSAFAFPIRLGEKFLGAVSFFCENRCPRDESLVRMFVAVGGNIGQFIKRERTERSLRESEENFRALVRASSQAIWTTDRRGQNLEAFGWWENQTGQTREQSAGAGFLEAFHPDDREPMRKVWQTAISTVKFFETEQRIADRSGKYRYYALRGVPVFNADQSFRQWIGTLTDISDRKLAEQALKDNEARYRALVEATSTVVWRAAPDGELSFVGSVWEDVSGQQSAGSLGSGWLDTLHPDDREKTIAVWQHSLTTKNIYETEFRVLTATGEYRWFAVRGVPIPDGKGGVREWVGANTDIHESKLAQEKLRESESRFRNMADNAPVMIWVTDATGFCNYLSQTWYEFTGQTPATGLGFGWLEATHPDDLKTVENAFLSANERGEPFRVEYRLRGADNSYIWAIDSAQPRFNENGEFLGYIGSVIDITERKAAEESLRESQEVLSLAMSSSRMGAWSRDLESEAVFWSAELEEIFGLSPGTFAGNINGFYDYVHAEDQDLVASEVQKALDEQRDYIIEFRFRHADGSLRWMEGRGQAVYADDGKPIKVYGIGIDITERKTAETERERLLVSEHRARQIAEQANHGKDEFIALVSHELRSPLNAMLGWTRILQKQQADEATTARALDVIVRNALSQSRLIEDLLDIARLNKGKLRLEIAPLELIPIINAAVEITKPAAESKNIVLTQNLDGAANYIAGDGDRLRQVVENLLANAVKFTPDGGSVSVRLESADRDAVIVISDTGQGISPEFLPQIFERFKQADPTVTRRHGGLGIGLSLARDLVELHGGRIAAQSEGEGKGATFTVMLPV